MIIMDCNQGAFIRFGEGRERGGNVGERARRLPTDVKTDVLLMNPVDERSSTYSYLRSWSMIPAGGDRHDASHSVRFSWRLQPGQCDAAWIMWEPYEPLKEQIYTRGLRRISLINCWWVLTPPLVFPARHWLMGIGEPTAGRLYVWLCAGLRINMATYINITTSVTGLLRCNGYDSLTRSVYLIHNRNSVCSYSLCGLTGYLLHN